MMRSHSRWSFARPVACALVFAIAASHAPRLAAAGNDADAGTWRMIVMTGPAQIAVAPPASTSSADYQAELTALKAAQGRLTRAQQKAMDYWGRGGVLRWNEIMLEMVARADLPPPPNVDGTYSAPDANNPFADPQFPFGNPPYAARAYSYVIGRTVRRAQGGVVLQDTCTTARRRRTSTAASAPCCRPTGCRPIPRTRRCSRG